MPAFSPSRLALARKRRGFTKIALAERAGISTRMLTEYEHTERAPSAETLSRLADALDFPVEFFSGPVLEEADPEGASLRALSTLSAKQLDQAFGSATFALALAKWVAGRFKLPEPDIPQIHDLGPDAAAEAVRHEWGLGERPVRNMIHLLEAHGVRVFSLVEECAELDAFSFWHKRIPYVFLNTRKSAERSRMDAAHELGHLVLHWGHRPAQSKDAEHEAKAFGSAFLMPRDSIVASVPKHPQLTTLISAKRSWNVAVAAVAYRMHTLGLLSDWEYRMLFIEIGEAGYRRTEPESGSREKSQVLEKVFEIARTRGKSKKSIAEELNVPLDELNKVVFGLVLSPVPDRLVEPISPAQLIDL